ncbi:MAG: FKBP-type peptidyl-prolyl cis-trans isomerase [Telluria sp.]
MKLSFPLAAAFAALLTLTACGGGGGTAGTDNSANLGAAVKIVTETAGTGAAAASGNRVQVHYTGWLYSATAVNNKGVQFDTSVGAGKAPIEFVVGANNIIPGFSQGVNGMKVGGKRTVIVPSSLAYGSAGSPPVIPGNADLVFDLELVKVCGATC